MASSAYHVISNELENLFFRHNWFFRHTRLYKQLTLTKWWNYNINVQIWYSYFRHTGRLSFLDVLFLLVAVILSELHEKPRRKDWVTEKSTQKNLCEENYFSWLHALLSMSFFAACCDNIRASWETKKERLNYKNMYIEEFVWGT